MDVEAGAIDAEAEVAEQGGERGGRGLHGGGEGGAEERGGEQEVDRRVQHVPCRTRGDEVDEGAGEGSAKAEEDGGTGGREDGAMREGEAEGVRPGEGGAEDDGEEKQAEEENFAAEPGATPALHGPPGVGRDDPGGRPRR